MIASFPDRRFQLWEYRVSHGSLLLRSPRGPEIPHNVDIVFAGVEFVCAPRLFRGLEFAHGAEEDVGRAAALAGDVEADRVFVLLSEGRRHLVIAAGYKVDENQADIFDSPFS